MPLNTRVDKESVLHLQMDIAYLLKTEIMKFADKWMEPEKKPS